MSSTEASTSPTPRARITGVARIKLAENFAGRYLGGESIRSIADSASRSYGFVQTLLKETGVALRGHGGATRGGTRRATATKPTRRTPARASSALDPETALVEGAEPVSEPAVATPTKPSSKAKKDKKTKATPKAKATKAKPTKEKTQPDKKGKKAKKK